MFKKNYDILILVLTGLVVVVLSVMYSPVSADAPYYLAIARDIANGKVLYLDVKSAYTPLMMYANSFIFRLAGGFHYQYFIIFQYLVLLLSTAILNNILQKRLLLKKSQSLIVSLLFFTSIVCSDGYYIILEPYVILFTLLAIYYLLKPVRTGVDFFIAGACISLSFLSKQYGVLNILPFGYLLLNRVVKKKDSIKDIIVFCTGAILVIGLSLIYFVKQGLGVQELLNQLLGGAQDYAEAGVKGGKSLVSYFIGGKIFYILFIPLLLLLLRKTALLKNEVVVFSILGIIAFLLSTGVKSFQHYFINTFPFLFLLLGLLFKTTDGSIIRYWRIALCGLVLIFQGLAFNRVIKYQGWKLAQQRIAKEALIEYPKQTSLFIVGIDRFLYLYNDYLNSAGSSIGYSYNMIDAQKFISGQCTAPVIFSRKNDIEIMQINKNQCRYSLFEPTGWEKNKEQE